MHKVFKSNSTYIKLKCVTSVLHFVRCGDKDVRISVLSVLVLVSLSTATFALNSSQISAINDLANLTNMTELQKNNTMNLFLYLEQFGNHTDVNLSANDSIFTLNSYYYHKNSTELALLINSSVLDHNDSINEFSRRIDGMETQLSFIDTKTTEKTNSLDGKYATRLEFQKLQEGINVSIGQAQLDTEKVIASTSNADRQEFNNLQNRNMVISIVFVIAGCGSLYWYMNKKMKPDMRKIKLEPEYTPKEMHTNDLDSNLTLKDKLKKIKDMKWYVLKNCDNPKVRKEMYAKIDNNFIFDQKSLEDELAIMFDQHDAKNQVAEPTPRRIPKKGNGKGLQDPQL